MSRYLTSHNVCLPGQAPVPATVEFAPASGTILAITPGHRSANAPDGSMIDVGESYVLPGLVDCHVHLNEPGRTEWEGFATGTHAAAAGGVTTIIDMPLNSIPPTTTVAGLATKREAAQSFLGGNSSSGKQLAVDVGFWGGVIPGNEADLVPLIEAGVKGFKCFLIESGVDEFPCVTESDLRKALRKLEGRGVPLLFHAEMDAIIPAESAVDDSSVKAPDATLYSSFLASRPDAYETTAIELIVRLGREFPTVPLHIVHLSSAEALPTIRKAKQDGVDLTVETCYHYLCLEAESIPDRHTEYKCCPPIRSAANRSLLWEALLDGTIDYVVSDHSPCVPSLKNPCTGDFFTAWGGISSLGLGISLLWTESRRRLREPEAKQFGIAEIVRWTSERTAARVSLEASKGQIQVGLDASFAVFDPMARFEVLKDGLFFKNKVSPFEGATLEGRVTQTYLRGNKIWDAAQGGLIGPRQGEMI